jgi:hypothetical protein
MTTPGLQNIPFLALFLKFFQFSLLHKKTAAILPRPACGEEKIIVGARFSSCYF